MDYLNLVLPFLGLGGLGIAFYILGGAVVLSTLNSVLQMMAPVISGAKDFLSWYFRNLWDGIGIVMKNTSTFLVIGTLAVGSGYAAMHQTKKVEIEKCETKTKAIIKKQLPTKKVPKTPTTDKSEWWDPFGLL